ncbi:MAG TPA: hypothetical protein VGS11_04620 [Candidatus Bathyarchaeia archaeon]|nr:hypothetical protein [Candidatus Bathyarchaeia archaeon]
MKLPEKFEEAKSGVEADPPELTLRNTLLLSTTVVSEILGPVGETVIETFILPEKPPRLVIVTVELSDGPDSEEGLADMLKSGEHWPVANKPARPVFLRKLGRAV